jgi:hypothetical protein
LNPRRSSPGAVGLAGNHAKIITFVMVMCVAGIATALHLWGAAEIRADFSEVLLLTGIGAVWLAVTFLFYSWLGICLLDDVCDRNNPAALAAVSGAIIAMALVYAGGGIGEGPSYLNNVVPTGLGAAGIILLWLALEAGARVSISVSEERDVASGLRLGGFLMSIGLIFGRAEAGDWHSDAATVHDFLRDGWPAGLLLVVALFGEWFLRPNKLRPFPSGFLSGLLPALLYLALAAGWTWHLGPWEGMPK